MLATVACRHTVPQVEVEPTNNYTPLQPESNHWVHIYNMCNSLIGASRDSVAQVMAQAGSEYEADFNFYCIESGTDSTSSGLYFMFGFGASDRCCCVLYEDMYEAEGAELPAEYRAEELNVLTSAITDHAVIATGEILPFGKYIYDEDGSISGDYNSLLSRLAASADATEVGYAALWTDSECRMEDDFMAIQQSALAGRISTALFSPVSFVGLPLEARTPLRQLSRRDEVPEGGSADVVVMISSSVYAK